MIEVQRGIIYRNKRNGMFYRHDGASWEVQGRNHDSWYPAQAYSDYQLRLLLEVHKVESVRILTAHGFDFPLTLDKSEEGMFVVTYGAQVTAWQKWVDAFNDFTECVAHAANEKGLQHIH